MMKNEIAKSPEMLQKEARIKELNTLFKKERTTLKRLKTRLKNVKEEIEKIQREYSGMFFGQMERMFEIKERLLSLFEQCAKIKDLDRDDKQSLTDLRSQIEEGFSEEGSEFYDEYQERKAQMENPQFEDDFRAKMNDMFEEFQVKPTEQESKDIRKVFIKLSVKFHPDKAKNDKEAKFFHGLMQQINEAYKAGDIEKLLEIEQTYFEAEEIDFTNKAVTIDLLQLEIERLERNIDFVKNQIARTSEEIKTLRQSDLGKMHTEVSKQERNGFGTDDIKAEGDDIFRDMEDLANTLEKCLEAKSLDPLYGSMDNRSEDLLRELMGQALGNDNSGNADMSEMSGMFDMLNSMFDEFSEEFGHEYNVVADYEQTKSRNPKFEIGDAVILSKFFNHPCINKFKSKNAKAWILNHYQICDENHYDILFDLSFQKTLSPIEIRKMYDENLSFATYCIDEKYLRKSTIKGSLKSSLEHYKRTSRKLVYSKMKKKDLYVLESIIDKFPEKSEAENWTYWINNNLKFPVNAFSDGCFDLEENEQFKILKILDDFDPHIGHTMLIEYEGKVMESYFHDASVTGRFSEIFKLYDYWVNSFSDFLILGSC